jgi:hypothetical protein
LLVEFVRSSVALAGCLGVRHVGCSVLGCVYLKEDVRFDLR